MKSFVSDLSSQRRLDIHALIKKKGAWLNVSHTSEIDAHSCDSPILDSIVPSHQAKTKAAPILLDWSHLVVSPIFKKPNKHHGSPVLSYTTRKDCLSLSSTLWIISSLLTKTWFLNFVDTTLKYPDLIHVEIHKLQIFELINLQETTFISFPKPQSEWMVRNS